jgi:hypothetical protein
MYRAARALRRLSTILLIVLIVFVVFVAYSAVQIVQSAPRLGPESYALESNDTVGISASFTITNPSLLAIQQFGLEFRVLNGTGVPLLHSAVGPKTIDGGSSAVLPVALYIPFSAGGASLLTQDQYLEWEVWGNATYGYLFTVSLEEQEQKAWGAPFDNVAVAIGMPGIVNGSEAIPVTLAFSDDASFADTGTLDYQVVSSAGPNCATGSFVLNVPPGAPYSHTQDVPIISGCNPTGGEVDAQFVGPGFSVSLPPEPIP